MNIDLRHGECIELMKDISNKSIDMILCDLPYGITDCKWDTRISFDKLWEQYNRIIKDNGCIALFGTEPFSSYLRISNIKNYKYDWIWNKINGSGFLTVKYRPMIQTENISIFSGGKKINYYPIMTERPKDKIQTYYISNQSELYNANLNKIKRKYTQYYPQTILPFSNSNRYKKLHPVQKPVPLLEYLIKTYTLENETVLDNCMGSGSTGVACLHLNRNFIGIELDDTYFAIAKDRIENEKYYDENKK
jgi:site-specific DNA-methyltransferase (adenine-specific)